MEFQALLAIVESEPVFETSLLLAGDVDPPAVQQQLSRWVRAGKLHQIRRGLYALAPPWRKVVAHPFVVSNRLVRGSYVSLEAALSHYDLIPDVVFGVTAASPARPGRRTTPLGRFSYHHLAPGLLWGYRLETVAVPNQVALVATPEKALLDRIHLTPGGDDAVYIDSLRLQGLDRLDLDELQSAAERSGSPKLRRAAEYVAVLARREAEEYLDL